jgi:UDP-2-acetamido-3-amino-2,3-dideoxy-glucuronate N-acetyltransferase
MTNLKFPSGIGAHIFVSWLNPYKEQKLVIVGSGGMLVFDDTQPVEAKLVNYPHTIDWHNGVPVPHKADSTAIDITPAWKEPLQAECEAFLDAMNTGTQPLTSGEEGLRVLKILELSQQSIEQKEGHAVIPAQDGIREREQITKTHPDVFIHETAVVDEKVQIGPGTKIWHFSHVLADSSVGKECTIGQNVVIGPEVAIGDRCKIQNNVSVYKGVTLEDGVFCGPSMVFTNVFNPRAEIRRMDEVRPTLVRRGATIGANATIVCGVTIGRWAFIGAGAVVTDDVPDHALVVGNPAKQVGWVCECGEKLTKKLTCKACKKTYEKHGKGLKITQGRS